MPQKSRESRVIIRLICLVSQLTVETLDFPVDHSVVLREKNKLKKKFLDSERDFLETKIAILGGSTTTELQDQLELFLLNCGIKPSFYSCEFGRYYETVLYDNEELIQFDPDIVYVHVSVENLVTAYKTDRSFSERSKEEFEKFVKMWMKLQELFDCFIIQDDFEQPLFRPFGSFDADNPLGVSKLVNDLNVQISDFSSEHSFFKTSDRNYLSSKLGLHVWKNYSLWLTAKYSLSHRAITTLSYSLSRQICGLLGQSKKCLVLDLDNTLW